MMDVSAKLEKGVIMVFFPAAEGGFYVLFEKLWRSGRTLIPNSVLKK